MIEIVTDAERREAWLADRRTAITATDAAKILGVSRFGGPMDVWLEKMNRAPAFDQNAAPLVWGRRLERTILSAYAEEERVAVNFGDPFTLKRSALHPIIGATLDATRADDGRPVDAKNVRWASAEWGETETDQVPLYYGVQLVMQMHVEDRERADLAVLFSGNDLRVYRFERDHETEQAILAQLLEWHTKYVVGNIEPPADASESFGKYIRMKFPQSSGEIVSAAGADEATAVALGAVKDRIKSLTAEKVGLENYFKDRIRSAAGMKGKGWAIRWTQNKPSIKTEWEGVARNLAAALPGETVTEIMKRLAARIDRDALDPMQYLWIGEELAAIDCNPLTFARIVGAHTEEKEGNRPFNFETKAGK